MRGEGLRRRGRGQASVASGVQQAAHYADDYGKFEAYLLIVNLSGRQLELPTDGGCKTWPSCSDLAGVRVYLVTVRAKRVASAGRPGTARPVVINRDDLVNPDVEDQGEPSGHGQRSTRSRMAQKRCWSRRGVKFLLQGECLLIGLSLRLMPLMQCEIYLLGRKCPPGSIFCISPR